METKILFTSESVSEGHPDKLCDQISDAILDYCLAHDPESHVACECFATTEYLLIGGEITSKAKPDYERIARDVMRKIGYTKREYGIGADTCKIEVKVKHQSLDIAQGVNQEIQGAGDQGIMFGYATNESDGYMPLPLAISHKLVRYASNLRKMGVFKWARPDMKAQVTMDYTDVKNIKVHTVLMSVQHDDDYNEVEFKKFIYEEIMKKVVKSFGFNDDFKCLINPTGRFVTGGPEGDTGLTGRKIIVDTYGGSARHGGGAFSGKDPSKVDRSAAYMARYVAKNLVAAGVADKLEVQLSYAIGVAKPLSVNIEGFGTLKYDVKKVLEVVDKLFDLTPAGIINKLSLTKPSFKYEDLASYGHFGRPDLDLPWEKLDKVDEIRAMLK
ncbi:MAG: methionine adenosyltransferase [Erysipelotrichales bacterium]|nr:methionine adenosyltransferase [Erysipelotrichales bacterium]